jgi:hypothetical protein
LGLGEKALETLCNSDTLTPDMKIRKNDIVKTNKDLTVGVYEIRTLPAGTLLQVWKATKQGELYCTTLDRKQCSHTVITNESSVTKEEHPLPTVNVGDIFVSSWGYDQTNVDFYTVLTVKNKTAVLVEIGKTLNYTGHMQGICIPNPKEVGNKPLTKRIFSMNGSPYFKMSSYASASPWNGREQHFSEWA